jgi:murein DD-endopeptidase MepM/ murein hydrolase activator NlpD
MALPIAGGKVGTPYGKTGSAWSHGIHKGVDFPCKAGTDVLAAANGKVIGIGSWGSAFGTSSVIVEHDLNGHKYWAVYAHLMKALVKKGDSITKGQHIGESGGRAGHPEDGNVFGEHLHFEVQKTAGWAWDGHLDPQVLLNA